MALDAPNKRLYVGCRRSAKLLVLDTDSGRIVASPDCVGDADDVFIDPKTGRVFVIGGDGEVDVFETPDRLTYTKALVAKTVSGARTGLLVAERRVLLVAVPKRGGAGAEIREYALPD
jgi:DNA-binding beta-propeller fold protein YncE